MKIKAVIIDDETNNIENLQLIIAQHCPDLQIEATADTVAGGIEIIQRHQPDLVFLDIQMQQESGFDLLTALPHIKFEVIFITAYDKYGTQAIKFSALDYLLKPIDIREFKLAVSKAENRIKEKQQNRNIENLLTYVKSGNREPKIALPTLKETVYVKITEIVRCEAENNYTTFHLRSGEQVLVCKTLKEFADLLKPHDFIRSHQSHLVNLHVIKSYLKEDGGTLLLENLQKVPISRQNREMVKLRLGDLGYS